MLSHRRVSPGEAESLQTPGDAREEKLRLSLQSHIISSGLHESRGSLVAILGYAKLLLDGAAEVSPDERKEYLQVILANAQNMTLQLKTLARLVGSDELSLADFDFIELWSAVMRPVALQLAARSLHLNQRLPARPVQIAGDAARLGGALRELWGEIIDSALYNSEVNILLTLSDRRLNVLITTTAHSDAHPSITSCRVQEMIRLHGGSLESQVSADRVLAVTLALPLL